MAIDPGEDRSGPRVMRSNKPLRAGG